jgi:hypothetical protein
VRDDLFVARPLNDRPANRSVQLFKRNKAAAEKMAACEVHGSQFTVPGSGFSILGRYSNHEPLKREPRTENLTQDAFFSILLTTEPGYEVPSRREQHRYG